MMANEAREQAFAKYIEDIKNAKSEQPKKERFLTLLANGAFFGSWAQDFVDQFAKGSEDGIFNIQRKGKRPGRGFADTQYGSVIIEFEDDLKKTGAHAADQLRDYLSGKWNSGIQARFTLIATDCLVWKIYSPDKCIWKADEFGIPDQKMLKIDSQVATDDVKVEFLNILSDGSAPESMKSRYAVNYRFFVKEYR